mmetsp:Transcript_5968/g.8830  ORF Transcript_5968/g.8830 Transcript_5968/m.8830 type:complete len:114 (-) Transcript_5968:1826-2167(-)
MIQSHRARHKIVLGESRPLDPFRFVLTVLALFPPLALPSVQAACAPSPNVSEKTLQAFYKTRPILSPMPFFLYLTAIVRCRSYNRRKRKQTSWCDAIVACVVVMRACVLLTMS